MKNGRERTVKGLGKDLLGGFGVLVEKNWWEKGKSGLDVGGHSPV